MHLAFINTGFLKIFQFTLFVFLTLYFDRGAFSFYSGIVQECVKLDQLPAVSSANGANKGHTFYLEAETSKKWKRHVKVEYGGHGHMLFRICKSSCS